MNKDKRFKLDLCKVCTDRFCNGCVDNSNFSCDHITKYGTQTIETGYEYIPYTPIITRIDLSGTNLTENGNFTRPITKIQNGSDDNKNYKYKYCKYCTERHCNGCVNGSRSSVLKFFPESSFYISSMSGIHSSKMQNGSVTRFVANTMAEEISNEIDREIIEQIGSVNEGDKSD